MDERDLGPGLMRERLHCFHRGVSETHDDDASAREGMRVEERVRDHRLGAAFDRRGETPRRAALANRDYDRTRTENTTARVAALVGDDEALPFARSFDDTMLLEDARFANADDP